MKLNLRKCVCVKKFSSKIFKIFFLLRLLVVDVQLTKFICDKFKQLISIYICNSREFAC